MRKLLNMDEDVECIQPRQHKNAMKSIIRATVYGLLKHTIDDFIKHSCEGCILQAPGQDSHVCLTWTEKMVDTKYKFVCDEIALSPFFLIATAIAFSLKCLSFNQESMHLIFDLVSKVGGAPNSNKALGKILKESDLKMLKYVQGYIKDEPYRAFFQEKNK